MSRTDGIRAFRFVEQAGRGFGVAHDHRDPAPRSATPAS